MRKKILLQITAIIVGFMILLLVIIDVVITQSSTWLFMEAKEELLSRDMEGIVGEMLSGDFAPEIPDYCKAHMDEVSTDVFHDKEFISEYQRVIPGLLERYGVERLTELDDTVFPELTPEEQAMYAHMWYYNTSDFLALMREYYGFYCLSIVDISEDNFGRIICYGSLEDGPGKETLESIIDAETERNGTLRRYTDGKSTETGFGMAYNGRRGSWFVGYMPLQPITRSSGYVLCIMTDLKQFNDTLTRQLVLILIFSFLLIAVFAVLLILFLNRRTVKPVTQIQKSVRQYTDDKDTGKIVSEMQKVRVENEFGMLAGDISHLAEEIERYTNENISLAAEHERIVTELDLANKIQMDALPAVFPAFPGCGEFDIYASMTPAKEVGGDFYDFFLLDDDHLALVIADVSGKGMSAALFMMSSKILIQGTASMRRSPAEILDFVNRQICENNKANMFVTVWLGILEISTGKLIAANAGHEYPMLLRNGRYELYKDRHGMGLGVFRNVKYTDYELTLQKGDGIFVYTDGVAEATDANEELFGTGRTLDALNADPGAAPERILKNVRAAVDAFVQEAPQFDDLTMLCLRYYGAEPPERLAPLPERV